MQCPVDGETLVMTERSGVEIDYCPKCRGVWLDRGELDKIIERADGGDAARPVVMTPPASPAPVAQQPVAPQPYAQPTAAPDLHGRPAYTGEPAPFAGRRDDDRRYRDDDYRDRRYRDDDDDYGRHRKRKKRESFLSELFDFD